MIINFSHPLRPKAVAKLVEMFPGEDLADIKCQVGFNEPLKPQIVAIMKEASDEAARRDKTTE